MTDGELLNVLKSSGIKFVYSHWPENVDPSPPYGVYLLTEETVFYADGEMYFRSAKYQVELYTSKKTPRVEKTLENAMEKAGIVFAKSETYIDSEKLFETLYEIEV